MQKVAVVTRQSSPQWVSCRSISTNLYASYKLSENFEYKNFYLDPQDSVYHGRCVALDIAGWQAEKVIFLDHEPHPISILKFWNELTPEYKPELIIHVYGDFSLNAERWVDCDEILKTFSVKFLCASLKQQQLINRFVELNQSDSVSFVVPFPVDKKIFHFDSKLRQETRRSWGLQDDQTAFLYTGRLSLQKNILQLIRSFDLYQRHINPMATLFLAGPLDDLGNPYLGKTAPRGLFAYDVQLLIKNLFTNERQNQIRYLGQLKSVDLNSAYCAADSFISLSTHHDEDYGMSPAEALMTGCPSLLTNWGGYSNFKLYAPELVQLVRVQMTNGQLAVNETEVVKSMSLPIEFNESNRYVLAEKTGHSISIEAVASTLHTALSVRQKTKFSGFTALFRKLAQSFNANPQGPLSFGRSYSSLYKDIYNDYRN